eukprot:3361284-Prymnesium_polylepis.1
MAAAWCSCAHARGPCWQGGERRRGGNARLVWGRQVGGHPSWQARVRGGHRAYVSTLTHQVGD